MKLLYITPHINGAGGVQRMLSVKLNYFVEHLGYDIVVLFSNERQMTPHFSFHKKIVFHTLDLPHRRGLSYLTKFKKQVTYFVNQEKPDIVLVVDNGLKGTLVPRWIKGTPTLYERHGSIKELPTVGGSVFQKIKNVFVKSPILHLAKQFTAIVVLNEQMKKEWEHKNICVIPNALWFNPKVIEHEKKKKKVIFVGRLTKEKGVDFLLEIWKILYRKFPDWELHVFGENTKEFSLITNKNRNIIHHQPVKNVDEIYDDASLLFLPSRYEGFGMVILEAMAYGIPSIAFNCPVGPSSLIQNGDNGVLVKYANIEEFASKAELLMQDENLRKKLSEKAFETLKSYNVEKIMNQWETLFKQMISNKKK
ncbi:glycosyltransferase family 4 protein [Mangrovimonas spongiae]|uniref:Glycosyltransferase family 4 protein n=1 Tax=Mangrovimonas spongiae TaxID=2494697 RepID=A0A428JYF0_9FLAO|nr:glycosyltransferase family 4 protein [Mangrovimonas spongiae]RSK39171.1 glycosyltransferase family 4 protein [Mangrovimonas spongiae]